MRGNQLVFSIYSTAASVCFWSFAPRLLKLMIQLSFQTNTLYHLAKVVLCLLPAWCSKKLSLGLELIFDVAHGCPSSLWNTYSVGVMAYLRLLKDANCWRSLTFATVPQYRNCNCRELP
ncbi:hypothetical protein I3843_16G023300 [Carya illinoinensis]|uniref:Uncharacterized protein n=1 Tax=Carya illinoinensis TaxID=32201 RepID=A0A921ZZI9_CARIL|nr:hypothetical protein I3842_16G020300 [Carya illinoinensis]KAG7941128.1 hypothetical protein I3843_16G023300 [Carya illinoinensis]